MTQKEALDVLKTGASVFLTGEPGSGKSHTIREYINYLKSKKITFASTASTGIAATHIGGVTIHSWSGIGIKRVVSDYDVDRIGTNERISKRILRTAVLIIDEISMLDSEVLGSVERVCREVKQVEQPFGGMQVVLVGDFFQLPPINKDNESLMKFAFKAKFWEQSQLLVCYLTEQFRQEDETFLEVLSAMRQNSMCAEHLAHLNLRCVDFPKEQDQVITKLFTHNVDVDRMNDAELNKIPGEAKRFSMQGTGRNFLVDQLKRSCLSPEKLILKKDAVVMFTKNSSKGGFVNGTLGKIIGFSAHTKYPRVETLSGKVIEVEPMDWSIQENEKVLARIFQMPLRLAWAITVHKSQGMSLDAAYIDLRDAFVEGQGYVAFSRVRSLKGLFLAGYNEKSLLVHPEVLERDKTFREQSAVVSAVFKKLSRRELDVMHKDFTRAAGGVWANQKKYSVNSLRKKYPKAYASWEEKEDKILADYYRDGKSTKEIAESLGRKPGAIRARLKKNGLVD